MKEMEKSLKALASRRRLTILKYLKGNKGSTVTEIAQSIRLSLKSTSKHLGILFAADILEKEQKSLQVYYFISSDLSPEVKFIINRI